ncbi:hypothetical protein DK37_05645, partial [Halomonas sp. SUBG004]
MVDREQLLADRIWQRYDRKERLIRYAALLATLMLVFWAVRDIDIFLALGVGCSQPNIEPRGRA